MKRILRLRKDIFYTIYYILISVWVLLLCIRYWKNPAIITKVNPGFPLGGCKEEPKSKMYTLFSKNKKKYFCKTIIITKKDVRTKKSTKNFLKKNKMSIPIVIKPNDGFQSIGVQVIHSIDELRKTTKKRKKEQIIQEFSSYPYELGVVYYKHPSQKKGTILGVSLKLFPFVVGDGKRTIRQLARKKIKISTEAFIKKQYGGLEYIPKKSEKVQITSMYKKKSFVTQHRNLSYHVKKPFIDIIEKISNNAQGFYFGRYDIKTKDLKQCLEKGINFDIIEVNAGAYATPLYAFDYRYLFFRRLFLFAKAVKKIIDIARANKDAQMYSLRKVFKEYVRKRKQKFAKL